MDALKSLQENYHPSIWQRLSPQSRRRSDEVMDRILATEPAATPCETLDRALGAQKPQKEVDFKILRDAARAGLQGLQADPECVGYLEEVAQAHERPAEELQTLRLGIRFMTEEDASLPRLQEFLADPKGEPYQDLLPAHDGTDGWWQGKASNCVTVAVIKAGLHAYGEGIFDEIARNPDGGYRVTLHDGVHVEIAPQELEQAGQDSKFLGQPGELPLLAYAVMAQRNPHGAEGLNSGSKVPVAAELLGLEHDIYRVSPYDAVGKDVAIASIYGHSFEFEHGQADKFGKRLALADGQFCGYVLNEGFGLEPRQHA